MRRTNVIGFAFALVLAGCETSEAPWSAEQSAATSQELGAVRGCESQARSCFQAAMSAADMTACQDALRTCLQSVGRGRFGDGGFGDFDGSFPEFDGSFPEGGFGGGRFGHGGHGFGGGRGFGRGGACGSNLNDAGIPVPPSGGDDGGGGVVPPGDDGGGTTTPPPPPAADGGTSGDACLQTLQQCLASTTPPATCAANAETCLATAQ